MYKLIIIGSLIAVSAAIPTPEAAVSVDNSDCMQQDGGFFSCIAIKAINTVARAARSSDIRLIDGISFVREVDAPVERTGKSLQSETEMLNELPREASDRTLKLISMFFESAMSFFKTHSLKLSIPEGSIARKLGGGDLFSGGGNKKGGNKMQQMFDQLKPLIVLKALALLPILLGGLALLVFKAVVVSKIAFLMALALLFKKFFGGDGSGFSGLSGLTGYGGGNLFSKEAQPSGHYDAPVSSQGWNSAPSVQGFQGYSRRSLESEQKDAQMLAYSAHVPSVVAAQPAQ